MRRKVESATINGKPWTSQGKTNQNYVIKFEGSDPKADPPERYIHVSETPNEEVFIVGEEVEFEYVLKPDNSPRTANVYKPDGSGSWAFPWIDKPKQQKQSFGGGGGGKSFTKSPEIFRNEMVSYCSSYAKDCIIHRVNLGKDAKEIIAIYEELVDGFVKASNKHIK